MSLFVNFLQLLAHHVKIQLRANLDGTKEVQEETGWHPYIKSRIGPTSPSSESVLFVVIHIQLSIELQFCTNVNHQFLDHRPGSWRALQVLMALEIGANAKLTI